MITLTPEAAKQIQQAAKQGQMENMALRIAATREADGSIQYAMGFADEPYDTDIHFVSENVNLVISPAHSELLNGCKMDYAETEPGQYNFIFMNPNDPHYKTPNEETDAGHHI